MSRKSMVVWNNEKSMYGKLCSWLWLASSWSPVEKLLLAEKFLKSDVCALGIDVFKLERSIWLYHIGDIGGESKVYKVYKAPQLL